jgi:hypothetical protein
MYNQDVLDLYPRVWVGAPVTVTWDRFKSGDGYASERAPAAASRGFERTAAGGYPDTVLIAAIKARALLNNATVPSPHRSKGHADSRIHSRRRTWMASTAVRLRLLEAGLAAAAG